MNNIICIKCCRRYKRPSYLLQYILFQRKGPKCQKNRIQMEIYLKSRKIQILQPVKRSRMRMLVPLVRVSDLKGVRQGHCLHTQMYETLLSLSLVSLYLGTTYLVVLIVVMQYPDLKPPSSPTPSKPNWGSTALQLVIMKGGKTSIVNNSPKTRIGTYCALKKHYN